MLEIPSGFGPLFRSSPFTDLIGPIYSRGEGETLVLGLRIEAKHANSRGRVQGGLFATLADVALGYALAFGTDPPLPYVTASLSIDYAGTAAIGDWVESRVDIQRKGSRLAFANCYLMVGDKRIVRASAVFALIG